jgi:cytochrome-b5 reductase
VIKEVIRLKSEGDNTKIRLIYANRKEEDILLRVLLDELSEANENFSVEYMLSQPTDTWKGHQGRLNTSVLEKCLPGPSPDTLVYVCGPPGFMETVSGDKLPNKDQGPVGGALRELGYTSNMVYKF